MKKTFLTYLSFILLFLISQEILAQEKYFKISPYLKTNDYMAKTIIFKVKPEFRTNCQDKAINNFKMNTIFSAIGAYNIEKKFPGKIPPAARLNKFGEKLVDLSLIYECKYTSDISLESAINKMIASGMYEYVQPHYLPHLLYVPNDPYADTSKASFLQWHLNNIHAYEAWDIQKGDTNIVIGIDDTGIDLLNNDLFGNIKKNYADPIDGIDNDGDGYVDNYYGWDLGDNDNNPQWNSEEHGIGVAALAAALTNDSLSGAGVGFKCKFLPIKIADSNGVLSMAYEGIVYAAEHGCSIINLSWGGYGSAGQYGQDIINYATNNLNVLVVAACGNSNNSIPIYPASYDNVISVAATDINDNRYYHPSNGYGSSYGIHVDIAAPGDDVYADWSNNDFIGISGTSFAAPIVCGAAAILKASHPNYSPLQLGEQLKVTTDNIDTIPANIPYAGLLGTGRLNMYKSLVINNIPSIMMTSNSVSDHNDMTFTGGDTLRITGVFKNYLATSSPLLNVKLSSTCPYVTILNSTSLLGVINMLDSANNNSSPFTVKILPSIPLSTQIDFKLSFNDQTTGYKSFQYFSIIVNIDYFNIDTNKVVTTMTSKGMIGYNVPEYYSQGIGFTYNNSSSLNCGGFLVGNSTAQVSDNIYGQASGTFDKNFKTMKGVHRILPPVVSDFDAETVFNDSLAGSSKLNLVVRNKAYAWASAPKDKFIIMEYTIKNVGTTTLSSLYAGLFMDFDMSPGGAPNDRIEFDATNKMGYTYSTKGGTFAAIKLLSNGQLHHFAFDKDGAYNGYSNPSSININDGFTSYEKYVTLKTNPNRNNAGTSQFGNDVADMISSGPFMLQSGDSVTVAFALIAGDHLADIQASAVESDMLYNHTGIKDNTLTDVVQLSDIYPNPSTGATYVNLHLPTSTNVDLSLFDQSGKKLQTITQGKLAQGDHSLVIQTNDLTSGLYHLRLSCGKVVLSKDVTIIK